MRFASMHGVEWGEKQKSTWVFPGLTVGMDDAGVYTRSDVNGLWPRGCMGAGCRVKRLRGQCLTCALAARKYWNPKLTPHPELTEAVRTLRGNCPNTALQGEHWHNGAATDYKERVGRLAAKELTHWGHAALFKDD